MAGKDKGMLKWVSLFYMFMFLVFGILTYTWDDFIIVDYLSAQQILGIIFIFNAMTMYFVVGAFFTKKDKD